MQRNNEMDAETMGERIRDLRARVSGGTAPPIDVSPAALIIDRLMSLRTRMADIRRRSYNVTHVLVGPQPEPEPHGNVEGPPHEDGLLNGIYVAVDGLVVVCGEIDGDLMIIERALGGIE